MIIAVDFDGILCEDAFPEIGKPRYPVISAVRQLIDAGHEVILWTSRVDERLDDAVNWCSDYGLRFCAVNGNAPTNILKYGTDPRKVYADVYIDDHSLMFLGDQRLFQKPTTTAIANEINFILNTTQEEN